MIVASMGCPASVGPEVSVAALYPLAGTRTVLCGSLLAAEQAAEMLNIPRSVFRPFSPQAPNLDCIELLECGPHLGTRDLNPRRVTQLAGQCQLAAIETAFHLVRQSKSSALVTAPVSKEAIASCGLARARKFRGHTEWLQALDGAASSTMCFSSPELTSTLVTTHLPLRLVARQLHAENVAEATTRLGRFLMQRDSSLASGRRPQLAVCSLNPHAGEGELLGTEESTAIIPGIALARRRLRSSAKVHGPIGAETAFRKAAAGQYDGVVAMYHDQATIPMKLLAFGRAVNVTLGLSRVRTSVDHGTAYDIAWSSRADSNGMSEAVRLAQQLLGR